MAEAMAHLLLCLGQHPKVQEKLLKDNIEGQYFDMVIAESLRLFPLFGIAHRIATNDISLPNGISAFSLSLSLCLPSFVEIKASSKPCVGAWQYRT